jgi:acyl-CoA synthetase (AMP-forming)/AMP-acid ligase II
MGLYSYTAYSIIKRNARIYKDRVSLISADEKLSHRAFLLKVDRVACGLLDAGLTKGDRIGILALNRLEYLYLYGAVAKIGAIMVPINVRLNQQEIEDIVLDSSPKLIFAESQFEHILTSLTQNFDFIAKAYSIDSTEGRHTQFDDLLKHGDICPEANVNPEDAYIIIYTSAVYGKPRGATLSHKNIIFSNLQAMYALHLTKEDVHIVILPLYHFAGFTNTLTVIQAGGSNIILPKFDTENTLLNIQKHRVTVFGEFSPMLSNILDKAQNNNIDLSSVRNVVGLDQPNIINRFIKMSGGNFWALYGQTETSGFVTLSPYSERPGSAGLPVSCAEIEIMDEYGKILDRGKLGEIVLRGPLVFKGYWNLEKDNEHLFRDGWHHTGDIGVLDSDGYLWYKGRKPEKELIKTGGENVYPAEIEKAILLHPKIDEACVIGIPDKKWGEAIKAICVLKEGESLNENDLIDFVAARIARFKKPNSVVFINELPKDRAGLIDREIIKEKFGKSSSQEGKDYER